MGKQSESYNFF